jgi:hypothetical protein
MQMPNKMELVKAPLVISACAIVGIILGFQNPSKDATDRSTTVELQIPLDRSTPPCIKMHYFIEKYAKEYQIPLNFAYGISYAETRYQGPFHWKYNHAQTSSAGAVGPMQIMPATAKMIWPDSVITTSRLKNDIELNVHTSMRLLRRLHDKYGDWHLVFGCYNTGRPMINEYAKKVYQHKINFL